MFCLLAVQAAPFSPFPQAHFGRLVAVIHSNTVRSGKNVRSTMDSRYLHVMPSASCGPLPFAGPAPYNDTDAHSIAGLDCEALFAEFAPLMRRLIRQYGRTPELRQELPGELYCRFRALLDSFDPNRGVPLRPYLVRQLTVGAYSFARKQWSHRRREAPLAEGAEGASHPSAADPTGEWDTALEKREIAASLPDMIATLPARQRQVVI